MGLPPSPSQSKPAAMFGEDSCGRKVSLLNTNSNTNNKTFTLPKLPKLPKLPTRSRLSSCSISSCASREGENSSRSSLSHSPRHSRSSPPTPPLLHFDSYSSRTHSTPSPMTPQYGFEPIDQNVKVEQNALPYYNTNYSDRNSNGYPSMHDAAAQPYYNINGQPLSLMNGYEQLQQQTYGVQRGLQPLQTELPHNATFPDGSLAQLSPQAFHTPSSVGTTTSLPPLSSNTPTTTVKAEPATAINTSNNAPSSASKAPASKKKYPCPHAGRYKCTDTFTTSGHAARHGKKHTGEKNILCPTCHKAFTRKDNMKQHERTHKGGSRSGSAAASPVISNAAGSAKGSVVDGDVMDMGLNNENVAAKRPKMPRSELSEIIEGISKGQQAIDGRDSEMDADGDGESPSLDVLATAATSGMA